MNWLICSVGRRVNLIKWFKEELNRRGYKLYVTDRDENAPALYFSDEFFILDNYEMPTIKDYIKQLIEICKKSKIDNVISIHDYHIIELSLYSDFFEKNNIRLLHSNLDILNTCQDKLEYNELPINQIPTSILKDRFGSASNGVEKIIQPYIKGKEYNCQCYFDIHTQELLDVFMQEKISMRAGETDKSISIWDEDILKEIKKLDGLFRGVIGIDCIKSDKVYIIDINCRFGGGYPLAHHCGMNYIEKLILNVEGAKIHCWNDYPLGVKMMKYNGVYFKDDKTINI